MSKNLTYRKKLIEVALPLEAINKESAREKSIRHGHPSTLHLWWARRPLSACRAVLFASLVDDPSAWPELFPTEEEQDAERKRLFDLIEELVKWENINDDNILLKAQTEIARSIARENQDEVPKEKADIQKYLTEKAPPVLDPFCGGGSIPLEAQRLGLRTYASDLNPVAVLITKALVEVPPKFANQPPLNPQARENKDLFNKEWKGARGLAEDVRFYGKWIRDEAEKRIGKYYPNVRVTSEMAKDRHDLKPYVGKEITVIAWLWARTIKCANPSCGVDIPLYRLSRLGKSRGKTLYVKHEGLDKEKSINIKIDVNKGKPTINNKGYLCPVCKSERPIRELRQQKNREPFGNKLLAIAASLNGKLTFIETIKEHGLIAQSVECDDYPTLEMVRASQYMGPTNWGIYNVGDLSTKRQCLALMTFSNLLDDTFNKIYNDSENREYSEAILLYLSCAIGRSIDMWTTSAIWSESFIAHTFGWPALPFVWDYAEANPFSSATGSWNSSIDWVVRAIEKLPASGEAKVNQYDAQNIPVPTSTMVSTDPPYYSNVPYADLSDIFYAWHRLGIGKIYTELFGTMATPKSEELVATPYHFNGDSKEAMEHFEQGMFKTFKHLRERIGKKYPATIYYAVKETETSRDNITYGLINVSTGWATMLEAISAAGFTVVGTWPVRTERSGRLRETGSNALASSIVMVCRPRSADAPLATRREFIKSLNVELPDTLATLQKGNIAPVDLAQAAIGPGIGIFSRYTKVIEADGGRMGIRTALSIINQVLDEVLSKQEGEFESETRWAIAWFEQYGTQEGPYGDAETLSRAKNTTVNGLVESGIINARRGKVHLLSRSELKEEWDPTNEKRLTIWEVMQHLIKALEQDGEQSSAHILNKVGEIGEAARDLAYRLYIICERNKWTQEALAYNSLVIAWPEITKLARKQQTTMKIQEKLFDG